MDERLYEGKVSVSPKQELCKGGLRTSSCCPLEPAFWIFSLFSELSASTVWYPGHHQEPCHGAHDGCVRLLAAPSTFLVNRNKPARPDFPRPEYAAVRGQR